MGAGFSSSREAIRPLMNENKMLYIYNSQYEGGVADKYTFCTGAVPEQQVIPVTRYLIDNFGPKIYIIAADYNFGQLTAMWTRAVAPLFGGKVIGQEFIPLSVSQEPCITSCRMEDPLYAKLSKCSDVGKLLSF
jgi:branched-chain amino acid transport system substrate-binding protein